MDLNTTIERLQANADAMRETFLEIRDLRTSGTIMQAEHVSRIESLADDVATLGARIRDVLDGANYRGNKSSHYVKVRKALGYTYP